MLISDLIRPSRFQVLLDEEKRRSAKESAQAEEWKNAVKQAQLEMEKQKQAFIDAGLSWPEEDEHVRKKEKKEKAKRQQKGKAHKLRRKRGKWSRKGQSNGRPSAGLGKMSDTSMFYTWPRKGHNPTALTATCNEYLPFQSMFPSIFGDRFECVIKCWCMWFGNNIDNMYKWAMIYVV